MNRTRKANWIRKTKKLGSWSRTQTKAAAACVVLGVLSLMWDALQTRPLSGFRRSADSRPTLEPKRQGLRFLGPVRNWVRLSLIVAGIIIFLTVM
ncbi:hypothetical protein BTE77_28180 [Ensifer adhaerens]|nr:hypothetical protein BTE77_28180 [Ensifer adhaerens]